MRAMSSEQRLLEAASQQALSVDDQQLSDRDRSLSDRDQARANADQHAADNDQRAAELEGPRNPEPESVFRDDGQQTTRARDRAAATSIRRASATTRAESRVSRSADAGERDAISSERDTIAMDRDAAATQMDTMTDRLERAIVAVPYTASHQVHDCDALIALQRADRARAAEERARAAEDRARAAFDREEASLERAALLAELLAAHHDDLTGVYRRTMGKVALTHALDRAKRGTDGFVLAFLDVDDMKGVNDRGGHGDGDATLRTVADILQRHLRSYDPVVRWGGDEFVAAIGGATLAHARSRLLDIQRAVADEAPTTVSFGLAAWDGDETLDALIDRADVALLDGRRLAIGASA